MSDSLKLLMFRDTLQDLGLNHKAQITGGIKYEKTDTTTLGNTIFQFVTFFIAFENKESFLYYRYYDAQQKMPTAHYKTIIKEFADAMIMDEETRIGEVGWDVKYKIHPGQFTLHERSDIIFNQARRIRQYIKEGYGGVAPCEGDVLTSYPYGPNVGMQLGMESWLRGKEDRAKFGKIFGLGDPKKNGWNYGRYDSNLRLKPI